MVLSQKQIDELNKVANKLPMQRLSSYAKDGTITEAILNQLTNMNSERRAQLLAIINAPKPNTAEQQEWSAIAPLLSQKDESLLPVLNTYISNWEATMPLNNHLDEARLAIADINAQKEIKEWDELDKNSTEALAAYLRKYPHTNHQPEIDNYLWVAIENKTDEQQMKTAARLYLQLLPDGMYQEEAKAIIVPPNAGITPPPASTASVAQPVAASPSTATPLAGASIEPPMPPAIRSLGLIETWDWMAANPYDANYDIAAQHFLHLKEKEILTMREQLSAYSPDLIFDLLEKGIFSEEELIKTGLATTESLNILREREEILDSLPDINVEIAKCRKECAEDHTDVFLFGIPSTGKTCILMGLIGSPNININTVRAGGPYACVLEQFLDAGLTIGQTPKDFVATIEASIQDGKDRHLLNLVEMAGEDFAFKIADNENGVVSFEDMGAGATKLLCNNNRKSFFIIVDPTAKRVAFNHLVNETDAEGNVRTYLVRKNVNQKIILKRLVDLLAQPENKQVLKNVDSISIVISKADLLGNGQEREEEAYRRFMDQHKNIIGPIVELCRENNINVSTNGQPMLYTFSLGHFYVGGVYQYDPTDANKLVEVLKGNTEITKKGSFGGKFKDIFN